MSKKIVNQTKKSLIWDLTGSVLRQFAGIFISIILARLLSPAEFGIIGMAMVFIGITEVFIDVGFTSGLIQQQDTKDIAYSSIFYVNLGISALLSLIIVLVAPYVSDFYGEPEIRYILYYLALIPIIAALGRVQATILSKRMDFRSLTIRSITATVIGGIAGVTVAYCDFGVYSLVVQQITTITTSTILLWFSTGWTPKLEFSKEEVKKLLSYSSYIFLDSVLRQIFNRIDTIFVGKFFSPSTLGFYSRADSLRAQIDTYTTNSLRKVMFPALSALQDDFQAFKQIYHKIFNVVTGLTVMLVGPIYFLSHQIIIGMLGQKWAPSIVFFQILLFSTLTTPQTGMMAQAVLAKGFSKLRFKLGLIQRLLKLAPMIFGYFFGIVNFAYAVVIVATLVFFIYAFVMESKFQISFAKQVKELLLPNIIFGIFLLFYHLFREDINAWAYAAGFVVCNGLFLYLIKHESLTVLSNNLKVIKEKISKFKR